jgi:Rrf2 family transcriptional regulator, iron-sulfur cluster assembly transcription factor
LLLYIHLSPHRSPKMFSKACEYGIKATLHIASQSQSGSRVSLKDIAKAIDSPVAFTAKILQQLAKNKIIHSVKGPTGGFEIDQKQMDKIKLGHIVKAIDGDGIYKQCGLGLKDCNEAKPCPVHHRFKSIRGEIKIMLDKITMEEMLNGLNDGKTFLRI